MANPRGVSGRLSAKHVDQQQTVPGTTHGRPRITFHSRPNDRAIGQLRFLFQVGRRALELVLDIGTSLAMRYCWDIL